MAKDIVSVIIPTHNDSPAGVLSALGTQSVSKLKYEVIVVDNASDKENIKNIVNKYPFAKYLFEPKKGVYFARNTGWRKAKGNIIAFTDADCIPDKNWIYEILKSFKNLNIMALGGAIIKTTPKNWLEKNQRSLADGQYKLRYKSYSNNPYIIAANMIFRKNIIEKLNGFNEVFTSGGDVDFSWRVVNNGYKIHLNSKAIIYHYPRPTIYDYFMQYFRYGIGHPLLYKIYNPTHKIYIETKNIKTLFKSLLIILTMGPLFFIFTHGNNQLLPYHFLEVIKCLGLICGRIKGSKKYKIVFI